MKRTHLPDLTISKYSDNYVEFILKSSYGFNAYQVHKIGVDELGRATYDFDMPQDDQSTTWKNNDNDNDQDMVSYKDLAYELYNFDLASKKQELPKATAEDILKFVKDKCNTDLPFSSFYRVWPKSTIDGFFGLIKTLARACNGIGVPAPEKLLASLAKATELIVTFEGNILNAGEEGFMADGSDDGDDN